MSKKLITIFGATGAQGGGLARAILAEPDGDFAVRAVTRKPDSNAAKALSQAGAEVVAADLDDAASVARAMQGAHGAFCVTNFWNTFPLKKNWPRRNRLPPLPRGPGCSTSSGPHWKTHA